MCFERNEAIARAREGRRSKEGSKGSGSEIKIESKSDPESESEQ